MASIRQQMIPITLTFLVFGAMWLLLHVQVLLLNRVMGDSLVHHVLWPDVLLGMTIYLKTSIDFAIFIAHLMRTHPGWKNRIAIECGTAAGNALGTFVVLDLWSMFREIGWLLALMVFVASLVLLKLAQDGLEHAQDHDRRYPAWFQHLVNGSEWVLERVNHLFAPLISWMPDTTLNVRQQHGWWSLLIFSGTVPFILGLDDFAGYVPLFSVVHVYGFALGVLAGHLTLNLCLFLSPGRTIKVVTQPVISFLGSLAFVGLALWGLWEAAEILVHAYVA